MAVPPPKGNMYYTSFPPPMPLTKAPKPIALPQRPHFLILALPFFLYVIVTTISFLSHLVKASWAYGLTIPSLHVKNMSRAPLQCDIPCSNYGALFMHISLVHHQRRCCTF